MPNPEFTTLSTVEFDLWKKTIPPIDWDCFVSMHHGQEPHARFVCALDILVNVQKREESIGLIVDAFCMATGAYSGESKTSREAKESFDLDPVRFLWDRIQRNATRAVKSRVESLLGQALESRLSAHLIAPDNKDSILKDAIAFVKMVRDEENRERDQLLARGIERLKGDSEAKVRAFEKPSVASAVEYVKLLTEKFGTNEMINIIEQAVPKSLQ